jgi:hypothetical protein
MCMAYSYSMLLWVCRAVACAAGLSQLSSAVAAGRLAVEGREAELREEINAALRKMRAYARDMEVRWGCCPLDNRLLLMALTRRSRQYWLLCVLLHEVPACAHTLPRHSRSRLARHM